MVLAEKIALLRRRQGWSQEELADRLDISRQAVSKWEGGSSVPELDKIVKMSELFGVTTDYLLKTEEEPAAPAACIAPAAEPAPLSGSIPRSDLRQVSRAEAEGYLALVEQLRGRIALGVGLFILSPTALLLLGAWTDGTLREDFAAGVGVIAILVMVALGLVLVVPAGMRLDEYAFLEKEDFTLAPGVAESVEQLRAVYAPVFRRSVTVGVALCVLSVVPLMAAMALHASDLAAVACIDLLLATVAVAVQPLIRAGMVQGSFDKLIQQGDYTPERKRMSRKSSWFAGSYWCLATAVYLGWSFWADAWRTSWIVWPVAGVLFAALNIALEAWIGRRQD